MNEWKPQDEDKDDSEGLHLLIDDKFPIKPITSLYDLTTYAEMMLETRFNHILLVAN